jgi:chromate reductase
MTRILLISGSTRDDSLQNAALRTAARIAPAGVTASVYDGLRDIPAFVPGADPAPGAVTFLRHRVNGADGVLFCTPEFAGSLPGSLKNLLDWLVDGGELIGKPAAWLSVSPGPDEGARATLETVLGHGGAGVLRAACIRVPLNRRAVDATGLVTDPRLHTALQDMVQSLARSPAAPQQRPQPSWQAYSSVYPMVPRPDASSRGRHAQTWRPPS